MAKKKAAPKPATKESPKAAAVKKPPAAKKPSKSAIAELIAGKTKELTAQFRKYELSKDTWESSHAQAASDKKAMELHQEKCNELVRDLRNIQNGNFTPPLPFKTDMATGGSPQPASAAAPVAEDVGGKLPLTALIAKNLKKQCPKHYRDGVGLTEAMVETLSKAIDGEKTIAQLEKMQRTNPVWNNSIRGFKEAAVTKLQDAHEILRRAFPIPSPDDKTKPATPAESSANAKAAEGKTVPASGSGDKVLKAFTEGQTAYTAGKPLKANPYLSGTPLALKWIEGYDAEKSGADAAK